MSVFGSTWSIALYGDNPSFETINTKFRVHVNGDRPPHKTYKISIPGMNGDIDLTDALGGVKYENREVKVWIISKTSTTDAECNAFIEKYDGQDVWLKNTTDSYQFRGRMHLDTDTQMGMPRKFVFTLDALPYKYALTEQTRSGTAAQITTTQLNFTTLTRREGSASATLAPWLFLAANNQQGGYAVYDVSVTRGSGYALTGSWVGAKVTVTNSSGVEYDKNGFSPTENTVRVKVQLMSKPIGGMYWIVDAKLNKFSSFFTIENTGAEVPIYYSMTFAADDVEMLVNGKHAPVGYTGSSTSFASHPNAMLQHGTNQVALVKNSSGTSSTITLKWREATI